MKILKVKGDGNCLFRSIALQTYGDEDLHLMIRLKSMQYIEAEKDYFKNYIEGGLNGIKSYIDRKSKDGEWGDDIEL